jgi:flagellar basal body-associated protein FliL
LKFLIKFEEAIDKLILTFIEKMKSLTPSFVYSGMDFIKHLPELSKKVGLSLLHKLQLVLKKFLGYFTQYFTMINGHIVGIQIYLRSEEFKKRDKVEMLLAPIRKFKTDPIKTFGVLGIIGFFSFSSYFIGTNAQKIFVGTKALRAPASAVVEEPIIEFKKLDFKVAEQSVSLDIILETSNIEERDELEKDKKQVEEKILTIALHAQQLPLTADDLEALKSEIMKKITTHHIRSVEIKQVLGGRPKYFMQVDKLLTMKNLNLQLFLEDTRRNRQVWIDFTALSTNRNIVLFLKDNDVQLRDHINTFVEPVIPQLPIEDEGRQIIRDKIKLEINEFLKKSGVEGSIQEIYLDYLMVT